MSKVITHENVRVEVYPSVAWSLIGSTIETPSWKRLCADLEKQIKRHVDGASKCETVWDLVAYCEYCGRPWTEVSETYNGGCCKQDEENYPARVSVG